MEERRRLEHEHEHEGTFSEGQESAERHPEEGRHGDFARGEEVVEEVVVVEGVEAGPHEHEGTFAEGQEVFEHHSEVEHEGKFSEGQELPDRIAEEERRRLEDEDLLP